MQERTAEKFVSNAASEKLEELVVGKLTLKPGLNVHIGPSAEGKRDGFNGKLAAIKKWPNGDITLTIYGGKGYQVNGAGKVANVGRLSFKEATPERVDKVW